MHLEILETSEDDFTTWTNRKIQRLDLRSRNFDRMFQSGKIRKPNKTSDLRMKMEMNGKFPLTRTLSLISVCEVCLKAIKIAESSDCQDRKVNNPVTSSVYLRVETIAELENATAKDNERKSTAHFWIY